MKRDKEGWRLAHTAPSGQWRVEKESLQIRDYRSTRRILAMKFPRRGTLIEIGCGMGYLINSFKKDGWEVIGIEPNGGLCEYGRQTLNLTMIQGTLDQAGLAPASVDAAIMMHVIEHVPDPKAAFRSVYEVLKAGGCFVVETPRYDTLMFRLLGRRERSLSCDGHIYFFTTETLASLATAAGFRIVRTEYVGRSLTLDRLLYNIGVISKSSAIERGLKRISQLLRLNRLAITVNVRDMQRIYLEKPKASAPA